MSSASCCASATTVSSHDCAQSSKTLIAGKLWMNWCMFGGVVACLPILLAYTPRLRRLDVDTSSGEPSPRTCEADNTGKHLSYSGKYNTMTWNYNIIIFVSGKEGQPSGGMYSMKFLTWKALRTLFIVNDQTDKSVSVLLQATLCRP